MWVRFIECMIEGFSLRKCAEQLNDEVKHVPCFTGGIRFSLL